MDLPIPPTETNPDKLNFKDLDKRLTLHDGKWYAIADEKEYEYNHKQSRWIDVNDDEDLNKQNIKKLKKEKISQLKQELSTLKDENKQRGIFISNLPKDTTKDELIETFSKYGKIRDESGIKLYYEDQKFKNEALIIYSNSESCQMAIEMMNETKFKDKTIKIEMAKFSNEPRILIKNMFRSNELTEKLKEDIVEDITEEVDTVIDKSHLLDIKFKADTIILKFSNHDSCELIANKFNKRFYDGLKIDAKVI